MVKPGDIVMYRLSEDDVKVILENRSTVLGIRHWNGVFEGEEFPLVAVRVWANEFGPWSCWPGRNITGTAGINGQVLLDGRDTHWVTSVPEGTGPGTWSQRLRNA